MDKLPNPMHVGDFYLAAILEELKGLRADQARAPAVINNGPIEFRGVDKEPPPPGWAPSDDPPSGETTEPKSKRQRKRR